MKIEYRICDLGDKHANPVNATFVVDNGEEEHDVCDIHVTTLVTAAVLNEAEYVTLTRIGSGKEKAPKPLNPWLVRGMSSKQSSPKTGSFAFSDEPCPVCGHDKTRSLQALQTHARRKHDMYGGIPALRAYQGPFHPNWLAWKERKENEVNG